MSYLRIISGFSGHVWLTLIICSYALSIRLHFHSFFWIGHCGGHSTVQIGSDS